ncbi:MAG: penicillin-binding protein activator [Pelagimonas sp.]|jgi:ABC-type branched-subunit amino acid transport system substrate-binding protein|nr:penicillin-binding protein activator [Pelagimonas sp.]
MFAVFPPVRKALRPILAGAAALLLAACDPSMIPNLNGPAASSGPTIDPGKPIQVALLVPKSDAGAGPVAASLEQAAKLAIKEQDVANIDLRVYDTAGNATTAAAQAQRAVDEGAKIILGPLFGEAANAAGLAVLDEGVNVLSFSNNPTIAGGNVFVLGPTFNNTAERLVSYGRAEGKRDIVVVYSNDISGQIGKLAIEQAAGRHAVNIVSSEAYELSIEGVTSAAQRAAAAVKSGEAEGIFITTDATNAAMPMLLNQLPENGVAPEQIQYVGMTRWDVRPDIFNLPGAKGAWFAIPDKDRQAGFEARYKSVYGAAPHPLGGLAYDGIAAIAGLAGKGRGDALTGKALTSASFTGTGGVFRLMNNGTNQRALAVATIQDNQMVILDPAPSNLTGAGF